MLTVHVCGFVCVGGGGMGKGGIGVHTVTQSLRSKLPCKLRYEAWLVESLKSGLCSFFYMCLLLLKEVFLINKF